jgi:MFS family permease
LSQLRDLLSIRDYRRLWLAQVATDFGDTLTFLSLLILVQRLTGSTVALAGLTISITLPVLVFSVLSGVVVDRVDRKKMMILSDVLRGVVVLTFLFARSADLVPLIYAIAFTQAAIGTLFNPARSAMLPRIVGERRLIAANSVSQTSRIVFNLLGTTAAGVLAGVFGTQAPAFVVNSAAFLVSALLIATIGTDGRPDPAGHAGAWEDMKSGFRVIRGSRSLRGVLLAAGVTMLGLGAVNVLMVPLVIDGLGLSETVFGLIEGAQVAGMVVAGGIVAALAARLRARLLLGFGLIGVGFAVASLYFPVQVWQLALSMLAIGLFVAPAQAGVSTLSQTLIPDSMRGRVGGALSASISVASVTSMGAAGVAAAYLGVRGVFVVAGAITVVAGILGLLFVDDRATVSVDEPVAA